MTASLSDVLAGQRWEKALFTTYSLSLTFFESIVLRALREVECREIWVIADAEGYRSSLMERGSHGVGYEYHLVPIGLRNGVFHPKCCYLVGSESDLLAVGSGNLTFGGFGRNLEVIEVEEMVESHSEELAPCCLHTLFYCAALSVLLEGRAISKSELQRGLAERVSLSFWTRTVFNWRDFEMKDFLRLLFENLILSQHFAVAARRFDGRTQRLRISIEEEGLEFLADDPFVPTVTHDRLATALSLMADCGLIGLDQSEQKYFSN